MCVAVAGLVMPTSPTASAQEAEESYPVPLATWTNPTTGAAWLNLDLVQALFPEADDVGTIENDPRVAPVYANRILQGYTFITRDITESLGFSSLPFTIAVGLRLDGTLSGARVKEHQEPIIDLYMIENTIPAFADQYTGIDIRTPVRVRLTKTQDAGTVDGITSATVSAVLFNEAILRAARLVALAKGIRLHDQPVMDIVGYRPAGFASLVADGTIGRMRISKDAARTAGVAAPDLSHDGMGNDLYIYAHERDSGAKSQPTFPDDLVIDLYAGPVMVPTIGRNLLGDKWYDLFVSGRDPNALMLGIMTIGPYSIDGEKHLSSGPFSRLQLRQDGKEWPLTKDNYRYLGFLHGTDKPRFAEIGLFWVPVESGIDPVRPWTLRLLVESAVDGASAPFELTYALGDEFILQPTGIDNVVSADNTPLWMSAWHSQTTNIAILAALLIILTIILVNMDALAKKPRWLQATRLSFLAVVLVWMGWYAGAQLTIINVLTWVQSLVTGTGLTVFLSDPLIVVLVGFVLVTFFIWGRGIFCGWLCPFGALQELLGKAAQALGVRQISLSNRAHQWLWPVKYVVLLGLVGLSFYSLTIANTAAEVEPFKTAISLRFARDWPYVVYALTLLAIGLTIERAFCRFLCPLGAAMAIGGRLRIPRLLKRREACGSPCQLCARRCPINAIKPDGQIKMDECFYCLDCQVLYHDQHVCPPLVQSARRSTRKTVSQAA